MLGLHTAAWRVGWQNLLTSKSLKSKMSRGWDKLDGFLLSFLSEERKVEKILCSSSVD